jgi:hypothetical protein
MNKKVGLFFVALPLSSFLISFVSAANGLTGLINDAIDSVVKIIKPFLEVLLGAVGNSELFMGKLIITIILLSLIYVILQKSMADFFSEKKWMLWVISIGAALLGVRYLTPEMITTIVLPNSALAVALIAGIPFVLFFNIVKDFQSGISRRISWIFFGVIFLGLYSLRSDELGDIAFIYPLTALLAFIMATMDGTISRWNAQIKAEKGLGEHRETLAIDAREKLAKLDEQFIKGIITKAVYEKQRKSLVDRLSTLMK